MRQTRTSLRAIHASRAQSNGGDIAGSVTEAVSTTTSSLPSLRTASVTIKPEIVKSEIEDGAGIPTAIVDAKLHETRSVSVFKKVRELVKGREGLRKRPLRDVEVKQEIQSVSSQHVTQVSKSSLRKPARRVIATKPAKGSTAPARWREIYDAVLEMRKERNAPVDTMGCESLAYKDATPRDRRFQTLIALMLSSQTKDTTNAIAIRNLQTRLPPPGLTLENILAVEAEKLNELIFVVGFHNTKTRHIKASAIILRDQFGSDIPDSLDGLLSLPGVGPKMAYLCLAAAWGKVIGIGVDVHVHRITNRWGWHKTSTPEDTRTALEAWLPQDKWHEINHLLVGFGQTICTPVGRRCNECSLATARLCPSAVTNIASPNKKRKRRLSTSSSSSSTASA